MAQNQPKAEKAKVGDIIDHKDTAKLWDEIGFHRPLAGFWHNLLLQILRLTVPTLYMGYLMTWLFPFPESRGYYDAISGLFVLVFAAFDLGTSNTINRFIADENIKNPGKMVQYVQYFIWYQSLTGLVQLTGISIWALYFVPNSELAYGVWIMLVLITKQWPGFPGVFKGIMSALQMYDKRNTIDFLQGEGLQVLTQVIFTLLGRWYGIANPEVGQILGTAIGMTFGLYFDDIIVTFIASYYLSKKLKPYGITYKRFFMVEFDWALVKKCTLFGVKMGAPGLLSAAKSMISLLLVLEFIPQYTTFSALGGIAISLVATTERLVTADFGAIFTEAYQNGKKKLCQYYNAHALRFFVINTGFAVSIILIILTVFEDMFIFMGMARYLLAIPFVIPALIYRVTKPYFQYPGKIMAAAHRPTQLMLLNITLNLLRTAAWYLTVVVFRVQDWGFGGIVYVIILTEFPVNVLGFFVSFIYINRTIFKIKLMSWQTFVVPILSTTILYLTFLVVKRLVLDPLLEINFMLMFLVMIFIMGVLVFGMYFPITVILGGWDENSLRDFRKASKMAGISKIIVKPLAKLIFFVAPKSKLHGRFKLEGVAALQEARELIEIRDENRHKMQKP